jgi:hypothetical protein
MCWKGKHAKLAWTFSWNITVFGIVNLQVHEKHENFVFLRPTMQRHNIRKFERKKILPDNELCGLSLISTSMCLRAIYICPWSVCLCCCRKICGPNLGIYKSLTDTWIWELGLRPRNSYSGNTYMGFLLQCMLNKVGVPKLACGRNPRHQRSWSLYFTHKKPVLCFVYCFCCSLGQRCTCKYNI